MKKVIFLLFTIIFVIISFSFSAPSISDITPESIGGYETINVSKDFSITENIMSLFHPSDTEGGDIREKLRVIGVGLFIIFIVRAGALMVLNADNEEEVKKAKMNFLYILYGGFLFFSAVWLLGSSGLKVGDISGVKTEDTIKTLQNDILGQIVAFFKGAMYFISILMIIYYGYKVIKANEKEDKIKEGRTGIINVLIAIVAIKVLDYVYYISQLRSFKSKSEELLVSISKGLAWIMGVAIIIILLYAGFLLVTSRGDEEKWKKAKGIIRNVFLIITLVFLFLIIIYDVIGRFG